MALTLEEQVRIEEEKIRKLREKIKKENKRKDENVGRVIREKFPDITEANYEEVLKKAMAATMNPDEKAYAHLGKIIAAKMPQYFSLNRKEQYDAIADSVAKFLERNKQYLNI